LIKFAVSLWVVFSGFLDLYVWIYPKKPTGFFGGICPGVSLSVQQTVSVG